MLARSDPPRGNGSGKVGAFTDMSLIQHELGKVRNRIGVRDLTTRAGAALIDLKPCWMMSPLAVSQYLHGDFVFDLVVIDEASQMTPENALGALMRARQVVVVGDTKQLPPTNFFSKILDDSDEDTRTDSESILDMAITTLSPVRQLRWHYRSRHLALIAISNKMVYEGQLTIFPAARDVDPDLGVHLVEVEGEYRKGRNVPEARAIVAGAIDAQRPVFAGRDLVNGDGSSTADLVRREQGFLKNVPEHATPHRNEIKRHRMRVPRDRVPSLDPALAMRAGGVRTSLLQ